MLQFQSMGNGAVNAIPGYGNGCPVAGPVVPRRPLLPLALSLLLLGISAVLNLALALYLAARP